MSINDELAQLEQRWALAIRSAGFGVWDLDPTTQTVVFSPEWSDLLGYPREGQRQDVAVWRARVHPDDLGPMVAALEAHLQGRTPGYEKEFRLRAADGRYLEVLSRGRVVERDAQGQALRVVGSLTDVTDRREAERLRRERDRLDAEHRARMKVLAQISHELRTPLNAVLGFAQLLQQDLGQADLARQRQFVDGIESAGWQLLGMIDQMLRLCEKGD